MVVQLNDVSTSLRQRSLFNKDNSRIFVSCVLRDWSGHIENCVLLADAALKVFGPVYVLTRGGPGTSTIVPAYYAYSEFFQAQQVGYGATIATALTLVIGVIAVVFIRAQTASERKERAGL